MAKIQKLSKQLSNQIAAGEVVERPASVVKELLENSLDSGADDITVHLEKGGLRLIKIQDNGTGIEKEDMPLAIARHATSKISSLEDLEALHSLGFRGEALASISSVSRFTLTSKTHDAASAWQLTTQGREVKSELTPAAHPKGTTISVAELFYNTPARRKFMRSARTELGHIEDVIKRIALSHFNLALNVMHDGKSLLKLPKASGQEQIEKRIAKLLGRGFMQHALALSCESSGLKIWGWMTNPEFERSQTDMQYFFINGRIIRDRLVNHALRQAYQDRLFAGRHPAYILYFELPANEVDVNVHPTKHEVRFYQSRLVHDFIFRSLVDALKQTDIHHEDGVAPQQGDLMPESATAPQSIYPMQGQNPSPHKVQQHQAVYQGLRSQPTQDTPCKIHCILQSESHAANATESHAANATESHAANAIESHAANATESHAANAIESHSANVIPAQAGIHYILAEVNHELRCYHGAYLQGAMALHHWEQDLQQGEIMQQPLLVPEICELPDMPQTQTDLLQQLGFDLTPLTENQYSLRAMPKALQGISAKDLVMSLFTNKSLEEQPLSKLMATMVKNALQAAPPTFDHSQAQKLITQAEGLGLKEYMPILGFLWQPLDLNRLFTT